MLMILLFAARVWISYWERHLTTHHSQWNRFFLVLHWVDGHRTTLYVLQIEWIVTVDHMNHHNIEMKPSFCSRNSINSLVPFRQFRQIELFVMLTVSSYFSIYFEKKKTFTQVRLKFSSENSLESNIYILSRW